MGREEWGTRVLIGGTAVVERISSRDIAAVARVVRSLGEDRSIVNDLAKEIRAWAALPREDVKIALLRSMPKRGGLNVWLARASVLANVRRGARSAGVKLTAKRTKKLGDGRTNMQRVDRLGIVRAPAWGHRTRASWHEVRVPRGVVTDAIMSDMDGFLGRVDAAVDRAVRRLFTDG